MGRGERQGINKRNQLVPTVYSKDILVMSTLSSPLFEPLHVKTHYKATGVRAAGHYHKEVSDHCTTVQKEFSSIYRN